MPFRPIVQTSQQFNTWLDATNDLINYVSNTDVFLVAQANATPQAAVGNTALNGTLFLSRLSVNTTVTLSGTLANVATTTTNISGNTTLSGPTNITSTLTISGGTSVIGSTLSINGTAVTLTGAGTLVSNVATSVGNTLAVAGAVTLSNTANVAGAVTLGATLGVTGAATLSNTANVAGATTLGSTLGVAGAATFSNTVTITGILTTPNAFLQGNVFIGSNSVSTSGYLTVLQTAAFGNTMGVAGAVTLSNTLSVSGTVVLSNAVSLATILNVAGFSTMTGGLGVGANTFAVNSAGVVIAGQWRGSSISTSFTDAKVTSVAGMTGAVLLSVGNVSGAAPLASPAFTGTPTAPTASTGSSDTTVATTAFVKNQGYVTSSGVTSIGVTAPLQSTGGTAPTLSIAAATSGAAGSLSAADKQKLDSVAVGAQVNTVLSVNGLTGALTVGPANIPAGAFGTGDYTFAGAVTLNSAGILLPNGSSGLPAVRFFGASGNAGLYYNTVGTAEFGARFNIPNSQSIIRAHTGIPLVDMIVGGRIPLSTDGASVNIGSSSFDPTPLIVYGSGSFKGALFPFGGAQNLGTPGDPWITAYLNNPVVLVSDVRYKTIVNDTIPDALDIVGRVQPFLHYFTDSDPLDVRPGFSAQQVLAEVDTHLGTRVVNDKHERLMMSPDFMIPILWQAVRDLHAQVRQLTAVSPAQRVVTPRKRTKKSA